VVGSGEGADCLGRRVIQQDSRSFLPVVWA
jgi:hypothetical protein